MTHFVVSEDLEKIDDNSFLFNSRITSVDIKQNIKSIGKYAFSNCQNIRLIKVFFGVNLISERAFGYCENLLNIIIPDSVNYIGEFAFSNCLKLDSLKLPKDILSISDGMFFQCNNLKDLVFGSKISYVGEWAFFQCNSLEKIRLPDGVEYIGRYAFSECENLNHVIVPYSLKDIGYKVFSGCKRLENISFHSSWSQKKADEFLALSGLNQKSNINVSYYGDVKIFSLRCEKLCEKNIARCTALNGKEFVVDITENMSILNLKQKIERLEGCNIFEIVIWDEFNFIENKNNCLPDDLLLSFLTNKTEAVIKLQSIFRGDLLRKKIKSQEKSIDIF